MPERLQAGAIENGGVYWFKVTSHGRIGHGSMPFLGVNAIERMGPLLEAIRTGLGAELERRTTAMPVVPVASPSPPPTRPGEGSTEFWFPSPSGRGVRVTRRSLVLWISAV